LDKPQSLKHQGSLGGYLGVFTLPNYLGLEGRMVAYTASGKTAAMYPVRQTGEARAVFLFRGTQELDYDHRDLKQQKRLLREAFGEDAWELPRLLAAEPCEQDARPFQL
jgi:hypothetical protein